MSDKYPEWVSLTADYTENPRMSQKDVDEARSTMSEAEFAQEYLASFNVYEGQIFTFNNSDIKEYVARPGDEVIAGLDPGYKDPTAFIVVVYSHVDGTYHIVDDYQENAQTTSTHVAAMNELIAKWGIESIFIDAAAAQFAADLAYTYDIATIRAKKSVLDGIATVRTLFDNRRIFISPHCVHTFTMLDQYRWKDGNLLEKEKPDHKESHMADALRYAVYSFVT